MYDISNTRPRRARAARRWHARRRRLLEVVEHRDRGDDVEALCAHRSVSFAEGKMSCTTVPPVTSARRPTDRRRTSRSRPGTRRAASRRCTRCRGHAHRSPRERRRLRRDPGEVRAHRLVRPRAIPICGVEDLAGRRVLHLEEAARPLVARRVAADHPERHLPSGGSSLPGLTNDPCRCCSPRSMTFVSAAASAYAARLAMNQVHGNAPSCRARRRAQRPARLGARCSRRSSTIAWARFSKGP